MLAALLGEEGDERAEKLTRDAWKDGVTPSQLWAMPVAHLRFLFFEADPVGELELDLLADLTRDNAAKTRPHIPGWLMPERRS